MDEKAKEYIQQYVKGDKVITIRENQYALVCPTNTSLNKKQYAKLLEIKRRSGCQDLSMAEFIRVKIIGPFISKGSRKYNI